MEEIVSVLRGMDDLPPHVCNAVDMLEHSDHALAHLRQVLSDVPDLPDEIISLVENATPDNVGEILSESAYLIEAVEGTEGLVWDICLLECGESDNRRYYAPDVVRSAVHLAENVPVFVDHPVPNDRPERSVRDLAGWVTDPSFDESYGDMGAWVGKFNALESGPIAGKLREAYERGNKDLIQFSIYGKGKQQVKRKDGRLYYHVTSIDQLRSLDAVTFGAAGGRVLQIAASKREELEMLEDMTLEELQGVRPDLVVDSEVQQELEEIQHKLALAETRELVETMVKDLPNLVAERVRESFVDQVAKEEEVKAIIESEQNFYQKIVKNTQPTKPRVQIVEDEMDKFQKALEGMIMGESVDGVTPFHSVHQAYCRFKGIDPWEIGKAALATEIVRESVGYDVANLRESISQTSWTAVFGNAMHKRLLSDYRMPTMDDWRKIVSNDNANLTDLRPQRLIRIGYYGKLPQVGQGNPYQELTSPGEEEQTYTPAKYGGLESWTWEDVVNDDLNALRRIPQRLAMTAKVTLYQAVFDIFINNPTMSYDSVALFHANHNNIGSNALSDASLSAGRLAMRQQNALSSTDMFLGITPKYLVVPNELEELGSRFYTQGAKIDSTNPNTAQDNVHKGKYEPVVVDYWADANNWYLVADPTMADTIEVGFLNGNDEPDLFTEATNAGSSFTADKVVHKIRFVFGVGPVDHRAFYGAIVA